MKRLRKFAIDLDRNKWPNDYGYAFYLKSRCLCGFIERMLKRTPVELVNSTKLVITGGVNRESVFHVNSSGIAGMSVFFDKDGYDELANGQEVYTFMIDFVKNSLIKLPDLSLGSKNAMFDILDNFEKGECVNEWVFKTKMIKRNSVKAILSCSMNLNSFKLYLGIEKNKKRIFFERIIETDPDEFAYHYKFKDMSMEGNVLIVEDRCGGVLFEVDVANYVG